MSKRFESLNFYEQDLSKKQLVILLSTLIFSLISAIFPILLILIFKNSMIGMVITVKGIVHLVVLLVLSNLISTTIGTTVGIIVKNDFSILISLAIYGLFISQSTNISSSILHRYFNIVDDYTNVSSSTLSEVLFNVTYWLDKIFLLALILLILLVVDSLYRQKGRIYSIVLTVFMLVVLASTVVIGERTVQTFVPYPTDETDSYTILSYDMDLILQNKLQNKASLRLVFAEDVDAISLLLDSNFKIEKVQIDSKPIFYTHENNVLRIESFHQERDEIDLLIEYSGKVFVENDLGVINFYTAHNAVNLPGHIFYWYPKTSNNSISKFNVLIDSQTIIYSNLTKSDNESNKWSGESTNFHLFSGQYQTKLQNNINYIFPISHSFDRFKEIVDGMVEDLLESDELSTEDRNTLKEKEYKQVIVGVWPLQMDFVELDGDTLLINYLD